jgi:hypothetical protein
LRNCTLPTLITRSSPGLKAPSKSTSSMASSLGLFVAFRSWVISSVESSLSALALEFLSISASDMRSDIHATSSG